MGQTFSNAIAQRRAIGLFKMQIQQHVQLKTLNTLNLNAVASHYVQINSAEEVVNALQFAQQQQLNVLVLSGGSNVLLPEHIQALVLHLNIHGIEVLEEDDQTITVQVGAGQNWHDFVQFTLQKNYGGLENLSLIPGNVGTSPMQNIGAYGVEIKDTFMHCTVYDLEENVLKIFDNASSTFLSYDSGTCILVPCSSSFNSSSNKSCILSLPFLIFFY